ncbi:hypothetical protein JCM3774_005852, partial [Rhodotorula dairenensis]
MASQDAFVHDHVYQYNSNACFVHIDPHFPQQVRDAAQVVARATGQSPEWADNLAQRADDAAPPPPTSTSGDDEEEQQPTPAAAVQDSPETVAQKRAILKDLVEPLAGGKLQQVADRDFIGFSNSILSLSLQLSLPADDAADAADAADELTYLVETLVGAIACQTPTPATTQPALSSRYSALATIFNALPPNTTQQLQTLRFNVLETLVRYAAENDDVAIVRPAIEPKHLEQYFSDDDDDTADAAAAAVVTSLLQNVANGSRADPSGTVRLARDILVARLSSSSSSSSSSSEAREKLAATLVALLLASNEVYDFTPYSPNRFPALYSKAPDSVLVKTLNRFASLDLGRNSGEVKLPQQAELDAAVEQETLFPSPTTTSNSSVPSTSAQQARPTSSSSGPAAELLLRVDRAALDKKLNLLRLAQLCEHKVGHQVPYADIVNQLGLDLASGSGDEEEQGEEVETWVID